MKVSFIISSLEVGGAETVLLHLLRELKGNIQPRVYSLSPGGGLKPQVEALGVPVRSLPMRPAWRTFQSFRSLATDLRAFSPDVVHTWMYHADLIGGLAARRAGVGPVAWGIHNSTLGPGTRPSTRLVVTCLARLSRDIPAQIQSCSHAAARIHLDLGYPPEKITVIPNAVDVQRFKPFREARRRIRNELRLPADTLLVGTVGRFHPLKDYRSFCRAAASLHRRHPRVHFVLVGRGLEPENTLLRKWVREAGVEECTHLLGPRNDVHEIMPALDVHTLSSSSEAFPVVLLEAMSAGVPCVATDVGDSALILGETGIVTRPGDSWALADGWERILLLPPEERERLGMKARGHVERTYAWPIVARQFLSFYEELARY